MDSAAATLTCPMAEPIEETRSGAGPGCMCRITRDLMGRDDSSNSLVAFCSGDYARCPTLDTFRAAEAEDTQRDLRAEIDRSVPRNYAA